MSQSGDKEPVDVQIYCDFCEGTGKTKDYILLSWKVCQACKGSGLKYLM